MTTWFTADLHFGHANIIDYSGRPFADATAMNQALIERWNDSIHPDDTVWVLGDVALGRIDETLALVGVLNGRKLLLAGNHDRCWAGHGRRAEGWTDRYLATGFAEVHQGQMKIEVGDRRAATSGSRFVAAPRPRPRTMAPARPNDQRRCRRMEVRSSR